MSKERAPKRTQKIIIPKDELKQPSAKIQEEILLAIWAFCEGCSHRKEHICCGYDKSFGKPLCELLWIFSKYKFKFSKIREGK